MVQSLNILVLGDAGIGKTSYLKRTFEGIYDHGYKPTQSIVQYTGTCNTNVDLFKIRCTEINQLDQVDKYSQVDGVMILFDGADFDNVKPWVQAISEFKVPVVYCATKIDQIRPDIEDVNLGIKWHQFKVNHSEPSHLYQISALSMYNLEKPLLYLMRSIKHNENLNYKALDQ